MNFSDAEQRRAFLSGQLTRGQITRESYTAAVSALRVIDTAGRTWQPDPQGPGWLCWNGTSWQAAMPPPEKELPVPGQSARTKDFREFRSSLMTMDEFRNVSKDVPLSRRPQRWWDLLSILGGIAAAVIWFLYGSVRSGQEGFDLLTPVLMIGIPVILVWLRADIDDILVPLQPARKKIPRLVLIGLGIAVPFVTAWLLYNIFHISQYPLMQWNIVVGTMVSYALVRDPVLAKRGAPGGTSPFTPTTSVVIFLAVLLSFLTVPAFADDCERDPLNAQDCLRTSGYAEVLAGTAAAGLGVLVNGPIILQGILAGSTASAGVAGAGTAGAAGSGTPDGGSGRIYGTGTPDDPFRDKASLGYVGPDGQFIPYPENANEPPKVFGHGTPDSPYTNIPPPVIDHTPIPPDIPVQPPEPPVPPTEPVQPPQPPEPPVPPTDPVQPPRPPEQPQPPRITPEQKKALIDTKKQIADAMEALRAKWQRRRWLQNTGVPNALKVRTAHWTRSMFKGGKDAVNAITDPKGKLWDGTKKKLGIETPLDKAKDKIFGKEVEMKDVIRDFKEADEKYRQLKSELDGMPSENELLEKMRDLKSQLSTVEKKLAGGGK